MGITSGVAGRYAAALFELAEEKGASDAVAADLAKFKEALATSDALSSALEDPSIPRDAMVRAMEGVAGALGAGPIVTNFVKLMASKRRLGALPKAIAAFEALLAEKRNEATVEVASAAPLSEAQATALRQAAERFTGKSVRMHTVVDPDLIGGVVLKIGSRMIDASVRSKLAALQHRMKEVG